MLFVDLSIRQKRPQNNEELRPITNIQREHHVDVVLIVFYPGKKVNYSNGLL